MRVTIPGEVVFLHKKQPTALSSTLWHLNEVIYVLCETIKKAVIIGGSDVGHFMRS